MIPTQNSEALPINNPQPRPTVLTIRHNYGFFSCCSVRLGEIVNFFNRKKQVPDIVNSSEQFGWYKESNNNDVTFEYFEHYNKHPTITHTKRINFNDYQQFANYHNLSYAAIKPFVEKYFSPAANIKQKILNLEKKYSINYENICVLFYRGNDKAGETPISSYDDYIFFAEGLLKENPNIVFLIQSDETQFINTMRKKYPKNSFYMKDEIRHIKKQPNTVDNLVRNQISKFSKLYLAITIIMSKCKYVVCGTGNCSLWIMLYRGNNKNVYQYAHGDWIQPKLNPYNVPFLKCVRPECKFIRHQSISNNGGFYCCLACKGNAGHGTLCYRLLESEALLKCERPACLFLKHTDMKISGGTHCCCACKQTGTHGPLCNRVGLNPKPEV
jgi:hypothetical protein